MRQRRNSFILLLLCFFFFAIVYILFFRHLVIRMQSIPLNPAIVMFVAFSILALVFTLIVSIFFSVFISMSQTLATVSFSLKFFLVFVSPILAMPVSYLCFSFLLVFNFFHTKSPSIFCNLTNSFAFFIVKSISCISSLIIVTGFNRYISCFVILFIVYLFLYLVFHSLNTILIKC